MQSINPGSVCLIIAWTWSNTLYPSVSPGCVITLGIYTFLAFDFLIASITPGTSKFGITLVYKLPGPITIISAPCIELITSSSGLQFSGIKEILSILHFCFLTSFGIVDSPFTIWPFSNFALKSTFSSVTGKTLPVIAKTWPIL